MTAALPSNLHAELALDRGRLSRDGSERSATRKFTRAHTMSSDPHARVQSLHGVIVETDQLTPSAKHGMIMEEPTSGTLSGAELAAALDEEEEADDDEIIRDRSQPQYDYQQRSIPPRQASLNNSIAPQQANGGAYPKSILQNRSIALSPPPRSSSCSVPASAPPQKQAFPDRPRFTLTDDGPISAPPSPHGSEFGHHSHSAPNSPGLGVTPPMRRGESRTQPSTPTSRYATFEEMGIQAKNAEKDKDCVIM